MAAGFKDYWRKVTGWWSGFKSSPTADFITVTDLSGTNAKITDFSRTKAKVTDFTATFSKTTDFARDS